MAVQRWESEDDPGAGLQVEEGLYVELPEYEFESGFWADGGIELELLPGHVGQ